MTHSASSPILSSDASYHSAESKSPAMSSFSVMDSGVPETTRPPRMIKKWSFSSALNLGSLGQKNKLEPPSATSFTDGSSHFDDFGAELGSDFKSQNNTLQVSATGGRLSGEVSPAYKTTLSKVGPDQGLIVPIDPRLASYPKRSTSSGIPFFRRSSSSSSNAMAVGSIPKGYSQPSKDGLPVQGSAAQIQNNRKTILGVGMSILKGSSSRRNLNRQPSQEQLQGNNLSAPDQPKHERKGSIGWSRKRSKVCYVGRILGRTNFVLTLTFPFSVTEFRGFSYGAAFDRGRLGHSIRRFLVEDF
jgi:hypothetical protein